MVLKSVVVAANRNCTSSLLDCSGRGQCLPSGDCLCDDNYITTQQQGPMCNYKQYTKTGPFLCNLFIGPASGCGYWMVENASRAAIQLCVTWIPLFVICIASCLVEDMQFIQLFQIVWILTVFGLWITSLVELSGHNHFKDGNGEPLGDW